MVCKSLQVVLTTAIPGAIHLNKDVQLACFSPNSALDEIGCWARSASHPRVLTQACDSLCSCESLFMCDSFFMRITCDSATTRYLRVTRFFALDSLFTQASRLLPLPQRGNFFLQAPVHHVANLNEMRTVRINHLKFRFQSLLNLHVISC